MQANATDDAADTSCPKCHSGVIDRGGRWMPWEKSPVVHCVCALVPFCTTLRAQPSFGQKCGPATADA